MVAQVRELGARIGPREGGGVRYALGLRSGVRVAGWSHRLGV